MAANSNHPSEDNVAPKEAVCIRCKEACEVVEDSIDHEFGSRRFEESLCCGAPVVWVPLKKISN